MEAVQFDRKLAEECAQAFSGSTGLGCILSDKEGRVFAEYGFGCDSCALCRVAGRAHESCTRAHNYGMSEAERFGGKYVYFCPMGLTCFVSPIVGEGGAEARITAGPFIMVEKQDFIDCELKENPLFAGERLGRAVAALDAVPYVEPERANQLSSLLFMAVGFMNNVSAENRMLEQERAGEIQGQISSYIIELKRGEAPPPYPFETEQALLQSIGRRDRQESQKLLNELLGAILFAGGSDLEQVKTRVYELLVLISRTAVREGAEARHALDQNHAYRREIDTFDSVEGLCLWLSRVTEEFVEELFEFGDAKHANIIHRCTQHIGTHYNENITLEETARMVYLSPTHLGRIFKQETGVSFSEYVNRVRVNKAKHLLRDRELLMTDISLMVGYKDQSYFTKVFKRLTGVVPKVYRENYFKRIRAE